MDKNYTFFRVIRLLLLLPTVGSLKIGASATLSRPVNIKARNMPLPKVCNTIYNQGGHVVTGASSLIKNVKNQTNISGTVKGVGGAGLVGATVKVKGGTQSTTTVDGGRFNIQTTIGAVLVITYVGYRPSEIEVKNQSSLVIELKPEERQLEEIEVISTGYQTIDRRKFTGASAHVNAKDAQRPGIPDISRMLEGQVAGVSVQNVSGTFGAAPKIRVRGATSITGDNKPLWVVDGVVMEDVVNISNDQLSSGDATTLLGSSVAGLNFDDVESFQILKDAAATSMYGARAMNGVVVITTKKGKVGPTKVNYTANFTTNLKPSYRDFDIMSSYDQMSIMAELERKGAIDFSQFKNMPNTGPYGRLSRGLVTFVDGTPLVRNTVESRSAFLMKYAQANTDWYDILFKNSLMMDHSLSISGGAEKSKFYFSSSYLQDNGWSIADKARRYTFNANGSFDVNDKLSIGIIGNGSIRDQRAPGTLAQTNDPVNGAISREFDINPFSYAFNTSRLARPYDDNGNLEFVTMNYAPFNILHELKNNYLDLKSVDLKVQGEIRYKLPFGIKYSFIGAYRYLNSASEHNIRDESNMAEAYRAGTLYGIEGENTTIAEKNKFLYTDPEDPDAPPVSVLPHGGLYLKNNISLKNFYFRNNLDWERSFGKHFINAFATQELRYLDRSSDSFRGYGFQYDKGGVPFIEPMTIKREVEGSQNYYSVTPFFDRFVAFAGSLRYSFDSRYQLALTGRLDGSNQLGKSRNSRWLPTWNISGSWNLDQEKFMEDNSFFNTLTIRGTYGLTASMGAAKNSSLWLSSTNTKRPKIDVIEPSMEIQYLMNEDLTWEKQYEANLGIDMTFADRRYTVALDLYNRKSFDLIGGIYTGGIDGERYKIANYADMKSQGIELLLRANIIKNPTYAWSVQLTNAYNYSKITNLINRPQIWSLVSGIGGAQIGYPHRGLFSIDFAKLNNDNGVPQYINHTGSVSNEIYLQSLATDYLKYEGPVDPTFTGGLSNKFSYKSFDFSFLVTYSAGNKVRLNPRYKVAYSDLDSYSYDFINRFVMPRESLAPSIADSRLQNKLSSETYNAYNYSNERVADGSFIRLKQITFSYNLPKKYLKKVGLNSSSISLVSQNPLLIYADKKLNGQDPEFNASGGVTTPIAKQFTFSFKASF